MMHPKKKKEVVETFWKKGLRILYGQFSFFNHFLKWFLMVSPKNTFVQLMLPH
jgi:hypothetical protein